MLNRILFFGLIAFLLLITGKYLYSSVTISGAPPYDTGPEEQVLENPDPLDWLNDWRRPAGPPRVGLQVGHWKNDELPDELERLRGNTGSSGGGRDEWQVNLDVANRAAVALRQRGIEVDILPATVPEAYWADVFLAIHADGNLDISKLGFKIAAPRRDLTGKSEQLVQSLSSSYALATGLQPDPNISRNMRGYYAFSWRRFSHAIHPMTTAAIIETGFLTSPSDRRVIVSSPQKSAQGIAAGIVNYLRSQKLLPLST